MRAAPLLLVLLAACGAPSEASEADSLHAIARRDLEAGRWADAVPRLQRVAGRDPGRVEPWRDLSYCLLRLDRRGEAVAACESGLREADRRDPVLLRRLLDLRKTLGQFDEAMKTAMALLAVQPTDALRAEVVDIERALAASAETAEAGRRARARDRYEEIKRRVEEFILAKRWEEALGLLESYPPEFRDLEYWTVHLKSARDRIAKLRDPH